ncbi:MAG: P-loop NTPase [Planctomyces sp.]|jgi:ATP-binding protein involved in chromosome partitioning|nr:Mrp/NBP35 family ATP-binding protein [Planctomyces sp.]
MPTAEQLQLLVSNVVEPLTQRSLGELRMVRDTFINGNDARVRLELPTPAWPNPKSLEDLVRQRIRFAAPELDVRIEVHSTVRGKDTGGRIGLNVHNVIAVGSGKGGVGKSTVAAALACGLHSFGCRVGLMDADVYGPSIPHMMHAEGRPAASEVTDSEGNRMMRMEPIDAGGVKLMSMGFFIDQGQSVVWRGPMLHKALTQFLKDTDWGELDYLIIDLPPGTGDVALTLAQQVGLAGAVVVCTPQQVALLDAIKAVDMYQKVSVPILGFIENMTGEVFGRGGVQKVAAEMKIPFLGEIPLKACIREYADRGELMQMLQEDNPAREDLRTVCQNVAVQIFRELIRSPAGPVLEIL